MNATIWDMETESLNLSLTRPWQLAYVKLKNNKIVDRQNLYIDIHNLKVNPDAAKVTGFSWEIYNKKKLPADHVVDIIQKDFIETDDLLVGHNILGYDIYILMNLYNYVGRKLDFRDFIYRCIDTLCMARGRFFEVQLPADERERLSFMYKMLGRYDKAFKGKLIDVAKSFNIPVDEKKLHDALYDVTINADVFKHLAYGTVLSK